MYKTVALLVVLACALAGGGVLVTGLGDFERGGELRLPALSQPVRVLRDRRGVPYIFAANTPDLIRVQGFVTAQHRLFQLEAYRAIFSGRLAETIGEKGLTSDIRMRVFGIRRNALAHASRLSASARDYLGWFVEGLNAYVLGYPADHHMEFSVAPFRAAPWSVEDIVTIVHYIHHRQSVNYKMEVVSQRLIDRLGIERAIELAPINVNPDREIEARVAQLDCGSTIALGVDWSDLLVGREDPGDDGFGSNNWVVAPARSSTGHAIVANDPHLDSRILPGIWHPVGLFAPGIQAVGATLPGLPGILIGRSAHVAFGVTNSYGDVQDLYVEQLDPADPTRYLDGDRSLPFESVQETIRIRDEDAPGGFREQRLMIRFTRRGPVISDHGLGPDGDRLLSLRTTSAEVHGPLIGIEGMLEAASADEFDRELRKIDLLMFNFIFADDRGHIGHRATGAVPRRSGCDGSAPRPAPVDGGDDWPGFIPKHEMPAERDPRRGWIGTANHDTRPDGYPHHYSSYFSPSYRYRRIREVLDGQRSTDMGDHWQLIRDDRNLQSDRLRSTFVSVLSRSGGDAHRITFVSPLRRAGAGSELLGGGSLPLSGSRDTLMRGRYMVGGGFEVTFHDSLRLVVDLGDEEKIAAVLPGGVVGRQFHDNFADQIDAWAGGELVYWWFSPAAVEANARHEQWLVP